MTCKDELQPLTYGQVVDRARRLFARDWFIYVVFDLLLLGPLNASWALTEEVGWLHTRTLWFAGGVFIPILISLPVGLMTLCVITACCEGRADIVLTLTRFGKRQATFLKTIGVALFPTALGYGLVVPGLALLVLFAFVAPVNVLERKSGLAAMTRSASMIMNGEWKRVGRVVTWWIAIGAPIHLALLVLSDRLHLGTVASCCAVTIFHSFYDPPALIAVILFYIDSRVRREGLTSLDYIEE